MRATSTRNIIITFSTALPRHPPTYCRRSFVRPGVRLTHFREMLLLRLSSEEILVGQSLTDTTDTERQATLKRVSQACKPRSRSNRCLDTATSSLFIYICVYIQSDNASLYTWPLSTHEAFFCNTVLLYCVQCTD